MYRTLSEQEQRDSIIANIETADRPTSLGVAIFGGGFSFGMEEAGFEIAGHLEYPDLALGVRSSRARWPVAVTDVNGMTSFVKWLRDEGVVPDALHANPPCVAFAGTGSHKGVDDDRMCYLRWCFYNVGMALAPKMVAWELVPAIWTRSRNWLESMAFKARLMGYRSYAFMTTSAAHGGFQNRKRFHFIASKVKLPFDEVWDAEPEGRKGWRTLGDALKIVDDARLVQMEARPDEIEEAEKVYTRESSESLLGFLPNDHNVYNGCFNAIFPFVPPGSHVRDLPDSVMHEHYRPNGNAWTGKGLPGFGHTRGRMDRPSPNIMGGHTVVHPVEDRYITPREAATVMGFPLDYEFSRGSTAYAEIGKGLCTHNAAFLGRVMRAGLEADEGVEPMPVGGETMIEFHDFRKRGPKVPKLIMSYEEQVQWWRESYPLMDVPEGFGRKRA